MKKIAILFFTLFIAQTVYADYITQDIVNGCDGSRLRTINNTTKLYPMFRIKTFTCNPEYFLPANTEHCVQCPNGYTCPGGTFIFNSKFVQGINIRQTITNNLSNVCSTNFTAGKFKPVFRPNKINLNWYDRNNIITQTTCTYGETITLPSTNPTRPGYTFTGWRLRQ